MVCLHVVRGQGIGRRGDRKSEIEKADVEERSVGWKQVGEQRGLIGLVMR